MAESPGRAARRKAKLEPISLEELASDPAMTGFTSLFRIPATADPLPHIREAIRKSAIAQSPTVDDEIKPTEGFGQVPTEGYSAKPTVGLAGDSSVPFFATEDGKLHPASRARPIRYPKDALSAVEIRVRDLLWELGSDEPLGRARLVGIGYDRLAALSQLNEKSVRKLLARLIEKGFLSVMAPADPHRRQGTQYRVPDWEEVERELTRRGWQWVVRSGHGVLYAQPYRIRDN